MRDEDEVGTLLTPRGRVRMEPAALADIEELIALYEAAATWMDGQGIIQWQPGSFTAAPFEAHINSGELYVARHEGCIAGALALQWEDATVWGERPPDAGYVHRLVVHRDWAGLGLGRQMLDWAAQTVAAAGRPYVRLDCVATNPALRAYYDGAGFTYLRDLNLNNTWHISLYEKRVTSDE